MLLGLTIFGLVVGSGGAALALLALRRAVPALVWTHTSEADEYELWNEGPQEVTILRASVVTPFESDGLAFPDSSPVTMDERLFGEDDYCRGAVLPPQRRYRVTIPVNTTLSIRYELRAFLGSLSKAAVNIEGDV